MKKTTQLLQLLQSNSLEFLMEAHNGISAKIVEETGFQGIWASGLSISAALGVRDNNEASWTQVLEVLEFMSEDSKIPILLDGDTGYGNFNNMRRLVKKLNMRGIAGVCIEDKLFPKTNSFIHGEAQPLADMHEFCGKIKAAKDTQLDPDFVVVARLEAFIAGWGLEEALLRAEAYADAGADAILCHSARADASEIESFAKVWQKRLPLVIVPTKYYSTPTELFQQWGVSLVIWANHNIRSAIEAMQRTSREIFTAQNLHGVEDSVVDVAEIFRLQGAGELQIAEKKYMPASKQAYNQIILAASRGEFEELTEQKPKTLLAVNGKPILDHQLSAAHQLGIKDFALVCGFGKQAFKGYSLDIIENNEYAKTGELYSLYLARKAFQPQTIISYGDIVYPSFMLHDLLNDPNPITLVVDAESEADEFHRKKDWVLTNQAYSKQTFNITSKLVNIHSQEQLEGAHGEFIGLWRVQGTGMELVLQALEELKAKPNFKQMSLMDLFNHLSQQTTVVVRYVKGFWLDIDGIVDLQNKQPC